MTKRKYDVNGYMQVKDNPISKVGVFPYLGKSISPECEPDKIYNVLRSKEELAKPETIESFKNIPWVDEHTMLGDKKDGLTPAEQKGVLGVIGEDVYFEDPYIKANLKLFSTDLHDTIENGKNELSCGYRCDYVAESGVFEGESYDYKQVNILGNHIATVKEGRMGPDVSVMDHNFTFDSKDLVMTTKPNEETKPQDSGQDGKEEMGMDGMKKMMDGMMKRMDAMEKKMGAKKGEDMEEEDMKDKDACDKDMEEKGKKDMKEKKDEKGKGMDSAAFDALESKIVELESKLAGVTTQAMDSANAAAKVALVEQVTAHVGTFDHSEKTLSDVQDYALGQFGLDAKGKTVEQKGLMLDTYFATNKPQVSAQTFFGQDAADTKVDFKSKMKGE